MGKRVEASYLPSVSGNLAVMRELEGLFSQKRLRLFGRNQIIEVRNA
jgi:hypothetical protein